MEDLRKKRLEHFKQFVAKVQENPEAYTNISNNPYSPGEKYYDSSADEIRRAKYIKPIESKKSNAINNISNFAKNFGHGINNSGAKVRNALTNWMDIAQQLPVIGTFKKEAFQKGYMKNLLNKYKTNYIGPEDLEIERTNKKIQRNIDNTDGKIAKKIVGLAPTIGEVATNSAGLPVSILQAQGAYLNDARERGMTEDKALGYSTILGLAEGLTEKIQIGKKIQLAKGAKTVKDIVKETGNGMLNNFVQEALMEPIQEITAQAIDQKGDFDGLLKRSVESGIDGALTDLFMSGASAGIGSARNVVEKVKNNQKISTEEVETGLQDIQKSGVNVTEELKKGFKLDLNGTAQKIERENNPIYKEIAKGNETYESAEEFFDFKNPNTAALLKNIDTFKKVRNKATGTKLEIRFTDSLPGDGMTFRNSNGDRTIYINSNSKNSYEYVLAHEMLNDLADSKAYKDIENSVINYTNKINGFENGYNAIKQQYAEFYQNKGIDPKTLNLDKEVVADVVARALGDQNFINSLAVEDKSTFNKAKDFIEEKINIFKSKDKEAAKLYYDVKSKFEKAIKQDNVLLKDEATAVVDNNINTFNNPMKKIQTFAEQVQKQKAENNVEEAQNIIAEKNADLKSKLSTLNKDYRKKLKELEGIAEEKQKKVNTAFVSTGINSFEERYEGNVGSKNVKLMSNIYPELKEDIAIYAALMERELKDSVKGERTYNDNIQYAFDKGWQGIKRITTKEIAKLLDQGNTYAEIGKALHNLANGEGKNTALEKRIELILHERLMEGYQDIDGTQIPAMEEYKAKYEEVKAKYSPVGILKTKKELTTLKKHREHLITEHANKSKNIESKLNKNNTDMNVRRQTRKVLVEKLSKVASEVFNPDVLKFWQDKKTLAGLRYEVNTMERNIDDIVKNKELASKVKEEYFEPIHKNEADKQSFINRYNEIIGGLKLTDKESQAVQMYGEFKYNPECKLEKFQVEDFINSNKLDLKKIQNAVEVFRKTYDELIPQINKVLKENAYPEIQYRKGYFPHFKDNKPKSRFLEIAEKLGFKPDTRELPTDIAGITASFKPGKTWFANTLQRKSDATDYNALEGFDNYIRGAGDIIYHTRDIQKLRALETQIRFTYADEGVKKAIKDINNSFELDDLEKNAKIKELLENVETGVPNFISELRSYTDSLANKKDMHDRGTEKDLGRGIYNIMTSIESRVASNMVGLNIGSALTNFIPITQALSDVGVKDVYNATLDTINAKFKDDGFKYFSTFIRNRKGSERLYKTKLEKVMDASGIAFQAIDDVTTEIVTRSKYLKNKRKGMSELEAIKDADKFAANIIADRSKGALPTIFNQKNPVTKVFTMFQVEANNQLQYLFKDLPREKKKEGVLSLATALFKMFIGAYVYNNLYEKIAGRRAALDPIDMVKSTVENFQNPNKKTFDKITDSAKEVVEQVPFIGGLIGGGRLPIQGAIPNAIEMIKNGVGIATGEIETGKAIQGIGKELSKPLLYLVPPTGGSQLKKTVEGISSVAKGKEYLTDSKGNKRLKYTIDKSSGKYIQAGVFGKYAIEEAQKYFKNGERPLSVKDTKTFESLNTTGLDDFREYVKNRGTKKVDKLAQLEKLDISTNDKWKIFKNEILPNTTTKEKVTEEDTATDKLNKLKKNSEIVRTKQEEAEAFISSGMSKEDYMNYYKKAYDKGVELPKLEEYKEMKDKDVRLDKYIDYKASIKNVDKKQDVVNKILEGDYTDKELLHFYSDKYEDINYIGNTTVKAKDFIKLKQEISNLHSDYTSSGKMISGSKKKKVINAIKSYEMNSNEKLLMVYLNGYKVMDNEFTDISKVQARKNVFNYVNSLELDVKEKEEILDNAGYIVKNGKVSWK